MNDNGIIYSVSWAERTDLYDNLEKIPFDKIEYFYLNAFGK